MIILIINYRTNLLCLRMFYMRSAFLEKAKQDIIRIIRKDSIFFLCHSIRKEDTK